MEVYVTDRGQGDQVVYALPWWLLAIKWIFYLLMIPIWIFLGLIVAVIWLITLAIRAYIQKGRHRA